MTLALYGKSRKRQGSLLLAALLAILVASIGGVSLIGTALAHTATITGTVTCLADGTFTVNWKVSSSETTKYMWIDTQTNPAAGTTNALSPDPALPNNDNSGPNGESVAATTLIPAGTTSVTLAVGVHWTTLVSDTGNRFPASGSAAYTKTVNPVADCASKIIIKKKEISGSSTSFTATVNHVQGSAGEASGLTFSESSPKTHSFTAPATGLDDYTVAEDALSGFVVTGKWIQAGDQDCPSDGSSSWVTGSPDVASGGALDDIGPKDVVTVCFRNEPRARMWVKKVIVGGGSADVTFPITVDNDGDDVGESPAGSTTSVNTPYFLQWNDDADNDDFIVTEAPGSGWAVTGWWSSTSANATCPLENSSSWRAITNGVASHVENTSDDALDDIDNGDEATVCFRNEKLVVVTEPTCLNGALCALVVSPGYWKNWDNHMTAATFAGYATSFGMTQAQVEAALDSNAACFKHWVSAKLNVARYPQLGTAIIKAGSGAPDAYEGMTVAAVLALVTPNAGKTDVSAPCSADLLTIITYLGAGAENDVDADCWIVPPSCLAGKLIVVKVGVDIPNGNKNDDAVGTVSPSINGDGAWAADFGGGQETFDPTPNGTYTVVETGMPKSVTGGQINLIGYKEATSTTECSTNANEYTADGVVTIADNTKVVCVLNKFVETQVITPSVDKANSSDGTPNLGESFNYTLKFTVPAGGNTTAAFKVQDQIPPSFTVGTVSPNGAATPLHCTKSSNLVECILDANTAPGDYTATIPVTVNSNAQCTTVINDVFKDSTTSGNKLDSDTVVIEGCGTITWKKTNPFLNPSVGDVHMEWTIEVKNTSTVPGSVTIYDPNTSLVSSACTNGSPESPAGSDTYTCTVPAAAPNSSYTVSFILRNAAITLSKCDNRHFSNTAQIAGNSQTSQTVEYDYYPTPDKSCLTVEKEQSDTSEPPTWKIKLVNTADAAVDAWVVDSGATYGGTTGGGSCTGTVGLTSMTGGIPCTINANGTLYVIATKAFPGATCEGTNVSNSADVWFGSSTTKPTRAADFPSVSGGTFEDLNANKDLCDKQITITKHYLDTGDYVPAASDLPTFTLSPSNDTSCGSADATDPEHVVITCTVPYDWDGTITEDAPDGWTRVYDDEYCVEPRAINSLLIRLVENVFSVVEEDETAAVQDYPFCNTPSGQIRIEKVDATNGAAGPLWDFNVGGNFSLPDGTGYKNPAQADQGTPFVSGPIRLSNTPVTVSEVLARTQEQCSVANTYFTVATPPADTVINTPGEVQTWTFQNLACGTLGTGGIVIEKYLDINGDGDANDTGEGPLNGWTFTTTGGGILPGNAPGHQVRPTSGVGQILDYVSGFDAGTLLTTVETQQAGYSVTRVTLDGANIGTNLSNGVVVIGGETRVIRYYNQPKGSIRVDKTTWNVNDGIPTLNIDDDDGWKITVDSKDCDVHLVGYTNQFGYVTFNNLPMCNDYVVAEDLKLPGAPGGYKPVSGGSGKVTSITPTIGGATQVNFDNETVSKTPPCTTCSNIVSTPTPTNPPTATPTTKPGDPTATPTPKTPISTEAGEKTPGPGSPTPIAPSTGGGVLGGTAGGFNILLILSGLLALTSGLSFVALGRKNRR